MDRLPTAVEYRQELCHEISDRFHYLDIDCPHCLTSELRYLLTAIETIHARIDARYRMWQGLTAAKRRRRDILRRLRRSAAKLDLRHPTLIELGDLLTALQPVTPQCQPSDTQPYRNDHRGAHGVGRVAAGTG